MYESVPYVRRTMTIGSCKNCPHYSEFEKNKNIYSVCMAQHKVSVGFRDAEVWFEECPIWEKSGINSKEKTNWKDIAEFDTKTQYNSLCLVRVVNDDGLLFQYAVGWYNPVLKKWMIRSDYPFGTVTHFAPFDFLEKDNYGIG